MPIINALAQIFAGFYRALSTAAMAMLLAGVATLAEPAQAGKVQVVKSAGGVEAWLIEQHDLPLIDIRIAFRGGTLRDPAGKLGLAGFAAYIFNEGGGTLNLQEFTARRNAGGIEVNASANADATVIEFRATTRFAEEGLELLALALNEPALNSDEIERARRELSSQLNGRFSDPFQYVSGALLGTLFPNHPLGAPPEALAAGLKAITAADIADFRRRTFARDNIVIAVVGDIDAATLAPALDQLVGKLPAKSELLPLVAVSRAVPARHVIDAALPQTIVVFGRQDQPLTTRERDAMTLIGNIINAPFTGPLFLEVREKRGLVYDVGAGIIENEQASIYSGSFGSAHDKAAEALEVTFSVLEEISRDGPTAEQFAEARDALPGNILRNMESGRAVVGLLMSNQLLKLPPSRFETFLADYQSITLDEVRAVAKKFIRFDDISVQVIGKPVGDITKVVPKR